MHNNENSKYVNELIVAYQIDVAIFCEFKRLSVQKICNTLKGFVFEQGKGGNDKIILLHRKDIHVSLFREQSRYSLYDINTQNGKYNIAGVHLPANPHGNHNDRFASLIALKDDLKELENSTNYKDTIVIGDFNTNPFSEEMIDKRSLNAVLFKKVIEQKETVKYDHKLYRRLYNPMLLSLSEELHNYGSYYYNSGADCLYWNLFDQFVINKHLLNRVKRFYYCKGIMNNSFVSKNGIPKEIISDHLPLIVEVKDE